MFGSYTDEMIIFKARSRATSFYTHLLNLSESGKSCKSQNNLISRVHNVCLKFNISLSKYIVDDKYANARKRSMKNCFPHNDGLNDSVRQLLLSHDTYDRRVLQMMLVPF